VICVWWGGRRRAGDWGERPVLALSRRTAGKVRGSKRVPRAWETCTFFEPGTERKAHMGEGVESKGIV